MVMTTTNEERDCQGMIVERAEGRETTSRWCDFVCGMRCRTTPKMKVGRREHPPFCFRVMLRATTQKFQRQSLLVILDRPHCYNRRHFRVISSHHYLEHYSSHHCVALFTSHLSVEHDEKLLERKRGKDERCLHLIIRYVGTFKHYDFTLPPRQR